MKKLFISQPMRGKTDEEILAVRKKAIESAEKLVGEPVEVIDSFFRAAPADAKPYGSLESLWNCWQLRTWRILHKDGMKPEGARLKTLVLLSTALQ